MITKRETFYFSDFVRVLPQRTPMNFTEAVLTKNCRRCGAEFQTKSHIRKRCDPCQLIVSEQLQAKSNEKLKAQRRARRAGAAQ